MLESLFNKVAELKRSATLIRRESSTGIFLWNWRHFLRIPFPTEHLWCLLLKSKKFNFQLVIVSFLVETRGFTNNPNFIRFKWRLERKHSPAKCVIRATEICRMEIRLYFGCSLVPVFKKRDIERILTLPYSNKWQMFNKINEKRSLGYQSIGAE